MSRRSDGGMVTAELATIAPFAVAFTFLLLWVVSLGLTQVRLADASREAARVIARGESVDAARRLAMQQSPPGAKVSVDSERGLVTVTVTARSRMPLPFFSGIGARTMGSSSVAAQESP
ncbi:TadE family type IV pilus minor pilin [Aeromicrobium sp.]|uniref:TadE family type IV pilus minor pilin n=1 Tax=Aeromicrobium sp. TaxID=1871063 RepID=UPI001987F458|nr:TadE family type IV pilus minor pilin [Aeromicrobium sp.]MBC7630283.1 pilus assembly protein [Aeromicrobium sp.]